MSFINQKEFQFKKAQTQIICSKVKRVNQIFMIKRIKVILFIYFLFSVYFFLVGLRIENHSVVLSVINYFFVLAMLHWITVEIGAIMTLWIL